MNKLTKLQKSDIKLIGKFVEVYCQGEHALVERNFFQLPETLGQRSLCQECTDFMQYAITRRMKCPQEKQKPSCKRCRIHCYNKANLEKVKKIMAYSGKKLILCGRLDYIWHYLF